MSEEKKICVSLPTVRRLPLYSSILFNARDNNQTTISSSYIAKELNLESIQVRKDLAGIGITGQAGVGFPIIELIEAIEKFLGWDNTNDAFIVGAGHLGSALAGYEDFKQHGLNIIALFDCDARKIGSMIHDKEVFDINRLRHLTERLKVSIGMLTVPGKVAQVSANLMVDAGIKAIWNFTPTKLLAPDGIIVERVDLAASLAVLSSKLTAAIRSKKNV